MRRWPLLLLPLFLLACEPRLEREDVPVWVEVRYEEQTLAQVHAWTDSLAQAGYSRVLITIPLGADSAGLPTLPDLVRADLALAHTRRDLPLPYGVAYTLLHPDSLFGGKQAVNKVLWMHRLQQVIQQSAGALAAQPPQLIILGHNYEPLEDVPGLWLALADSLRPGFPQAQLIYSTEPERVPQIQFWQHLDGIGIAAQHATDGQFKVYARAQHQELARWLTPIGKPIYITRTNLMGEDKLLKFKNILRFWPDSLPVQGLVLNTVFPTPAPLDTFQTYFGIRGDDALEAYLRAYQQRN